MLNVDSINACLPQTQCTRCGYPSCKDYATAINQQHAPINLCPPGDRVTINALAALTNQSSIPLDESVGPAQSKTLAWIDEARCIGCVLCIKACPVDAIVGANKQMHTVIQDHCTGCELCLPVCPTDCIEMQALANGKADLDSPWPGYSAQDIELSKLRFEMRISRVTEEKLVNQVPPKMKANKMDEILAAVKRRQASK